MQEIAILGFGAALINTMPVWIAEIARGHDLSDTSSGLHGSVVLLSAALSCGVGAVGGTQGRASIPALLVPLCLVALAAPVAAVPAGVALAACAALGGALGSLMARALRKAHADLHQIISSALVLGLMTALVIYLVLPFSGLKSLWILAALSLSLWAVIGPEKVSPKILDEIDQAISPSFPVLQFPFFVLMGAYWTYIELFASSMAESGDLSLWLLGSLLTGTLGSLLAGRIGTDPGRTLRNAALLCAAMSGAASYVAPTFAVLGISVLVNGFFLYLYFPLFLAERGTENRRSNSERRMAIYLLGFALGGAAGAGLLHFAGFPGLAIAIAMSGLVGVCQRASPSRS